MAINVYCGLMGSGKSYEAVSSIIVPAIAAGRRVVSNIDGLNESAIHEYILRHSKKGKKAALSAHALGSIVHVSNDRVSQSEFFPDPDRVDGAVPVVQPGDLVVIDEAWRFWPTSAKPSHEHMQFFRMHRHYAHAETGVTSDLVLLIQDISGLHPDLKRVVEMSVRTTKLKSLGLNRRYRVEVFEGYRQTKTAKTATYQKAYDKAIFPLYQSYGSGNARETTVDDRQNIFKGSKVWILLAMIPVFLGGGIWYLISFFGSSPTQQAKEVSSQLDTPAPAASALSQPESKEKKIAPPLSADWRIVGLTLIDERPWVVLQNAAGKLRYVHRSNFEGRGVLMRGIIDNAEVTMYSGSGSAGSLLSGAKK
ncbi:zonular occludens toxin family protein [Castellaniella ginsengisoli]|uniref:Zonular occludens toxin domain-containing protein n=1 Tax=Castellaniella ginsengisoli TaxID=546114 RepID=A0AB39DCD5_9BURK